MATDQNYPAYAQFHYTTAYAPHTHTRAMREITSTGLGDLGEITWWNDAVQPVEDMLDDYVALWADLMPDTATIDYVDLFRVPEPGGQPFFLGSKAYGTAGGVTGDLTGQRQAAVQHNLQFRSTLGGYFKLITLDRPSGNFYGIKSTLGTEEAALKNYIVGALHGWAADDNGRPSFFRNLAVTLNDRLMRAYGKNFAV